MTEEEQFELERIAAQFAQCSVKPFCSVRPAQEIQMPMPDGVLLRTILIRPERSEPVPTIIMRTCYPANDYIYRATGAEYAKRGFAFVFQYCRGTGGSGGAWEPNVNERADGKAAVDWICSQPWVESAGYCGCSYLALTGWAIADILPDKVKTMYLTHYGTFRHVSAYKDGLFRHDILTAWTMENAGFPVTADYLASCRYRPQMEVDEALWGGKIEWYREYLRSTDADDPYWNTGVWKMLKEIPGRVRVPLYVGEAWYDHHLGSAIETWLALPEETRRKSTFLIGAWDHNFMMRLQDKETPNAQNDDILRMFAWFYDILVCGRQPAGGVKLYLTGADQWLTQKEFRAQNGGWMRLYLNGDRENGFPTLTAQKPAHSGSLDYVYDPEHPVPSHGGESLLHTREEVGSLLQPAAGSRPDVISCLSQPLEQDLDIVGQISVQLQVQSDAEDTAFVWKLMEVTPVGKAYNIRTALTTLGYRNDSRTRLTYTPGTPVQIRITAWDVAYRVHRGSRLRLDITSSDFPQYAIHSNYAGNWAEQRKTRPARQSLQFGPDVLSCLELPLWEKE